jgi:hypothetical protein
VTADAQLADAVRDAWEASQLVVDHRDEQHEPSDALAFLRSGIQELADQRSPAARDECAKRFEIVSRWISCIDPPAAAVLADVAARLRMLTA